MSKMSKKTVSRVQNVSYLFFVLAHPLLYTLDCLIYLIMFIDKNKTFVWVVGH